MRPFVLLAPLFLLVSALSQVQPAALRIDPPCPIYGSEGHGSKQLAITYDPQSSAASLKNPTKPILDIVVNGPYWADNTRSVDLVRQGDGSWQAVVSHKNNDYWAYMMFQVRDQDTGKIDNNSGKYWDLVLYNPEGGPSFDGLHEQAQSYTGESFDNGMSRTPDFEHAISIIEKYLNSAAPDRYEMLSDYWDFKLRREADSNLGWGKVSEEVRAFIDDHSSDEPALRGAFNFVSNHESRLPADLYPKLMHDLQMLDPQTADRLYRGTLFRRATHAGDLHKRSEAMAEFITKYPDDRLSTAMAAD